MDLLYNIYYLLLIYNQFCNKSSIRAPNLNLQQFSGSDMNPSPVSSALGLITPGYNNDT
jgi:hypothetical protein